MIRCSIVCPNDEGRPAPAIPIISGYRRIANLPAYGATSTSLGRCYEGGHHQDVAATLRIGVEELIEPGLDGRVHLLDRAHRQWRRLAQPDRPEDACPKTVRPATFHPHSEDQGAGGICGNLHERKDPSSMSPQRCRIVFGSVINDQQRFMTSVRIEIRWRCAQVTTPCPL